LVFVLGNAQTGVNRETDVDRLAEIGEGLLASSLAGVNAGKVIRGTCGGCIELTLCTKVGCSASAYGPSSERLS